MKYIKKTQQEPRVFNKWRHEGGWDASNDPQSPSWNPKARKIKQDIKELLLKEQGYICCYCEEQITNERSHVEHIQPKGLFQFAQLKSRYRNIVCSCNSTKTCGHAKKNQEIKVVPIKNNCEKLFEYLDDGRIQGKNQDASDTICTLNLNTEQLNAARREIIDVFLYTTDTLTLSEYDSLVQEYLKRNREGHFQRFWTVIKYIAERYRNIYDQRITTD